MAAGAIRAESPTQPPKDLKLVGDHWTPWTPPEVGAAAYRIQRDDTLWDLAEGWLGDPYLWPQIWDENRYILDSHWIYPGDPLVVPGRPTVVPETGPLPVSQAAPPSKDETATPRAASTAPAAVPLPAAPAPPTVAAQATAPVKLRPAAKPVDLECSGSIEPDWPAPRLTVAAGDEDERISRASGDIVYLNGGREAGIAAGDEFAILRPVDEVVHPESGERLGTYVRRLGKLRVLVAHAKTATAVISRACEDVQIGDDLVPWVEIPIPQARSGVRFDPYSDEPSGKATGRVVAAADNLSKIADGHILHTDLGRTAGVVPGDVITLYRPRPNLPRLSLGQAVILTVEPGTSTAKVTLSTSEMHVGDWVEVAR